MDLFCGAGGAAAGIKAAGFKDVVGVDIKNQRRYPFEFRQMDALDLDFDLAGFDFIWASPPCQKHTSLNRLHNAQEHQDLIPATREMLKKSGVPYVIENVPGAPLINPVTLCGTMFGLGTRCGAHLRRHRIFECSFEVGQPAACKHDGETIGIYGGHIRNRRRQGRKQANAEAGIDDFTLPDAQTAMGINWMTLGEMCQAIPPAYSEYLCKQLIHSIS